MPRAVACSSARSPRTARLPNSPLQDDEVQVLIVVPDLQVEDPNRQRAVDPVGAALVPGPPSRARQSSC